MDKITKLRATRSDYQDEVDWGAFLLDAYAGTGGFAGKVKPNAMSALGWAAEAYGARAPALSRNYGYYLDQYPREDEAKFNKRREIAHYSNYVAAILDLHLAYVLRAAFQRQIPDAVSKWAADVDGRGTSMGRMLKEVIGKRAAAVGWCPVLLEMPQAQEGLSQAQAAAQGVRPVLVPLAPVNVLRWSVAPDGGLLWVKVRIDELREPTALGEATPVEIYKIYTRETVSTYEVVDNQVVSEVLDVPHGFNGVPVVAFKHKPAFDQEVRGTSMIADAAVAAKRLFNLDSELDEHFRAQVFAVLQVPVPEGGEAPKELIGGVDNALPVPANASQGYAYIAPPASVAAAYEARIRATVREIYRRARTRYDRDTAAAESGEAKAWDFAETNELLADFAEQIAISESKVYTLVAGALGASGTVTVTPPEDFAIEDLQRELQSAMSAIGLELGPSAEMHVTARGVERYLTTRPNEDREQILDELWQARNRAAQERAFEEETQKAEEDP